MIVVLRVGHRIERDKRITTHLALVSRAFGADAMVFTGDRDDKVCDSVVGVNEKWGGAFSITHARSWKRTVAEYREKGFTIVHLTFYGKSVTDRIAQLRENRDILVIVGGEKVPPGIYDMVDFNIAVTSQPHSEVAALAIFLDRYFQGAELDATFDDAVLRIIPSDAGKKVVRNE